MEDIKTKEKLDELRAEMRKKGAFSKYCSDCEETVGTDNIEEFVGIMEQHNKECSKKRKKKVMRDDLPIAG